MATKTLTIAPESATFELSSTERHISLTNTPETPAQDEHSIVRTRLQLYTILLSLYLVLFISALDQTITSIAVPTICSDLNSSSGYVWVGGAYLLGNAATGPFWAKCSDIWGRKSILLLDVAVFAAASIFAALSTSMPMLIAARGLQGAAAGGMVVLVSITISDLFSVRKRSLYLGYVGFVWALAGSIGPLIGGAFTQYASWRWCFWINLPICGAVFLLLALSLNVHNPKTRFTEGFLALDWAGIVSILTLTVLLFLGLDFGGNVFPWNSSTVICLLVFGAITIGVFIFSEHRLAKYPLVPLGVFKSWSNTGVFIVVFSHGMVLIGMEYYLPLYFQSVKQSSPIQSGLLLLPLVVTQAVVEILSGFVIDRSGRYRESIWLGVTLMTLGTGLYIQFNVDTSLAIIICLEIIGGLGPALLFQGPVVAVQNSVSPSEMASSTAALNFIRNVAMSLSVVVGGAVFQNSMESKQPVFIAAGFNQTQLSLLSGSQVAANVNITSYIQDVLQRDVVLDAFAGSFKNMFIMYTALSALAFIASGFVKHSNLSSDHTESRTGLQQLRDRANHTD